MEKFSYALEFYNRSLYSLDDTNLFKRKIKEAEKIERVLFDIIPNIDLVRKYILRSYKFDKRITFTNRLDFIKGLILADSIVSYDDVLKFSDHIENQLKFGIRETLWKEKGLAIDPTNKDILDGKFCDDVKIIEIYGSSLNLNNKSNKESDDYEDESYENNYSKSENCEDENYDYYKDSIYYSYYVDDKKMINITSSQKLDIFKRNKDNIVNEIIKRKNIPEKSQKMVKRGMNKWLGYVLSAMEDLYNMRCATLTYKAKNASDYL